MESSNQVVDLSAIDKTLCFQFDPILYTDKPGYARDYRKHIIYYILCVVEKNHNITINQICGLLRNTLQIPEDITRGVIDVLFGATDQKVLKKYRGAKSITTVHLRLSAGAKDLKAQLLAAYPDLDGYEAPKYESNKSRNSVVQTSSLCEAVAI